MVKDARAPVLLLWPFRSPRDADEHPRAEGDMGMAKIPMKLRNRLSDRLGDALFVYLPVSGTPMLVTPGPSGEIRTALKPVLDSLPAVEPRWILADLAE